mmetsp:Transcript_98352/g.283824  ORF Transcript_98352/g.283824 Transcript_98352/m.283824 type:complete len:224 (+) Transcript_98352:2092-2763(+)
MWLRIQAEKGGLDVGLPERNLWARNVGQMPDERRGNGHEGLAVSLQLNIPLLLGVQHRGDVQLLYDRRQLLVLRWELTGVARHRGLGAQQTQGRPCQHEGGEALGPHRLLDAAAVLRRHPRRKVVKAVDDALEVFVAHLLECVQEAIAEVQQKRLGKEIRDGNLLASVFGDPMEGLGSRGLRCCGRRPRGEGASRHHAGPGARGAAAAAPPPRPRSQEPGGEQ